MPFNFEKFTDVEASYAARITIRQTGQFGFNVGAINRFKINDYSFCVLYYDAQQRAIGLELVKETCEGAIEIKKSDSNTYLRAKNFCDRFAIDYSDSHRYELKQDLDTGLLYFELEKEMSKEQADQP